MGVWEEKREGNQSDKFLFCLRFNKAKPIQPRAKRKVVVLLLPLPPESIYPAASKIGVPSTPSDSDSSKGKYSGTARARVCVCVWILFCLWTIEPSHPTSLNEEQDHGTHVTLLCRITLPGSI